MSRPRAYQLNDPGTNYARQYPIPLPTSPTSPTFDLIGMNLAGFMLASLTGSLTGAEEDCQAYLVGPTAGPFAGVLPGDSLTIRMRGLNGGNPITVAFDVGDFVLVGGVSVLTAAKAARVINTALSAYTSLSPASDYEGKIQIVSVDASAADKGDSAYVTVTDVTAGIVQKLGFGAITTTTAYGVTSPKRGIITRSADNRGGYFPLRYSNGEAVLTAPLTNLYFPGENFYSDAVGGQAIYGRLADVGSLSTPRIRLSFFSRGLTPPSVNGTEGDFSSLNGTDTLGVVIAAGASSVTFAVTFGVVTSVTDAVNAINTAYRAAGFGQAQIISAFPEPYLVDSTDTVGIVVDGVDQTISFPIAAGGLSAQNVVDIINTTFGSTVAYVYNSGGSNYLQIKSPTTGGPTSTVQIFSFVKATLSKLGLPHGKVSGSNLCSVRGTTEIRFVSPFCDQLSRNMENFSLVLTNNSGTPLQKMGLPATVNKTSVIAEWPAVPPAWAIAHPSSSVPVTMLIPEMMERGDIPDSANTATQQFMNQDTAPQLDLTYKGIENANKPAPLDRSGLVPSSLIGNLPFLAVQGLSVGAGAQTLTPKISVPLAPDVLHDYKLVAENSSSSVTYPACHRIYTGRDVDGPAYVQTWNAKWDGRNWNKDDAGHVASMTAWFSTSQRFEIRSKYTGASWLPTSWDVRNPFQVNGGSLSITGDFICNGAPFTFADVNVASVAMTEVTATSPLPDEGADKLRCADQDIIQRGIDEGFVTWEVYSVFRSLNARASVSIGDGVYTFGDFNGTTALEDAIYYLVSGGIINATIHAKAGTYKAAETISLSNINLSIIGQPGDNVNIVNPTLPGDTIIVSKTGSNGRLWLKNINFSFDGAAVATNCSLTSNNGGEIFAEDCAVKQVKISNPSAMTDPDGCQVSFKRCKLRNSGSSNMPVVSIVNVTGGDAPIVFEDCNLYSNRTPGNNNRMVLIQAADSLGAPAVFEGLKFARCKFQLCVGNISGGNLVANTGLLDLHPGTGTGSQNDARAGTGMIIRKVLYENCDVMINSQTIAINVFMHLIPTANGTNATPSPSPFTYVDELYFTGTSFSCTCRPAASINPMTITGARRVFIENCRYTVTNTDATGVHGSQTSDCVFGFANTAVSDQWWANIAISADDITIRNFACSGFFHRSTSGDILLWYNNNITIDGMKVSDYSLVPTTGTPPSGRFFVFYGDTTSPYTLAGTSFSGSMQNIQMIGGTAASSSMWCLYGVMYLITMDVAVSDVSIKKFVDFGLTYLPKEGVIFHESIPLSKQADGVTIENCDFENNRGIGMYVSSLWHAAIRRNSVLDSDYVGMMFSIADILGSIDISENDVEGSGSYGIQVSYQTSNGAIRVCNNTCLYNDMASFNYNQIAILPSSGVNVEPVLVVYGNSCYPRDASPPSTYGCIRIARRVASATVALPVGAVNRVDGPYCGCETSTSGGTTFLYADGQPMLHNLAYLHTP